MKTVQHMPSGDGISGPIRFALDGQEGSPQQGHRHGPLIRLVERLWPSVAAVGWFGLVGLALLGPALLGGTKLGPYDLLSFFGLGHPATTIHNHVDSDLIQQFMPWTTLAWNQIHHGHLPLWNSYSGAGLPLAFDGQSSAFSLPTLFAYLVPVRYAFDVTVLAKLVVAGMGTYAFSRLLGLRILAAVFAGTVFELSGAFSGFVGTPQGDVFAFLGFVLAADALVLRDPMRPAHVLCLALAVAFAAYGGHPESIVITVLVLALFSICAIVASRALGRGRIASGAAKMSRSNPLRLNRESLQRHGAALQLVGLSAGVVAGLALAAPLLLPLGQLVRGSAKLSAGGAYNELPFRDTLALVFQGFDGFPTNVGHYFGASNYYVVAGYVGVTALVLTVVALVRCWRRPEVIGLALVGLACLAVVYVHPVASIIDQIPGARITMWYRALIPLDFVLAVLGGLGLHQILQRDPRRFVLRTLGVLRWAWLIAAAGVVALGLDFICTRGGLPPGASPERAGSFVWPIIEIVSGLLITLWLTTVVRAGAPSTSARRLAGGALLLVETGFLLWAGTPLWSSAPVSFAVTPAEVSLQHLVGSARIGFGSCASVSLLPNLGILPEANDAYAVSEFAFYDPIAPSSYYTSWSETAGAKAPVDAAGVFCPAITTVSEARRYGIRYVLEPPGVAGPQGTTLVGNPGGEGLYKVPDVSLASMVTPGTATERALTVDQVAPNTWHVSFDAPAASTIRLRFTDVPGWRASLDGRRLPLTEWAGVMLKAQVPAGHHELTLTYDPGSFVVGLLAATAAAALLAVAFLVGPIRRRYARSRWSGG